MNRAPRYALFALTAAIAAAAGYVTSRSTTAATPPAASAPASAAAALFALTLPDSDGQFQSLAQWRGKVIVVNFWATWCPPCRTEIPDFAAASHSFAEAPVQFVGLSIDTVDKVRQFKAELDVPYPLLIASPQVLGLAVELGNPSQGLPFSVIIDRAGVVREIKLGTLNQNELEGKIRALLAERS